MTDLLPYTLGLDIGSDSLGWAMIRKTIDPNDNNIIAAGVRIFPAGTNNQKPGSETSKCGDRRTARGMRRQLDRRSRRKDKLKHELREHGILTKSNIEISDLIKTDPYELRCRGLSEDLTPDEFARALIHLNQKRGFKSNRRSGNSDSKIVGAGVKKTKQRLENCDCPDNDKCATIGQYLHRHVPLNSDHRRNRKGDHKFYFDRAMVREEFDLLWRRQKQAHPDLLTDALYNIITNKDDGAIFGQRPFDQVTEDNVGRCSLEKSEPRVRLGHRLAQQFRIITEIDNIRIAPVGPITGTDDEGRLNPDQKRALRDALETKSELKIDKIPQFLELPEPCRVNLGKGGREKLNGNETEITLAKAFGKAWKDFPEDKKNAICEFLLEEDDDEIVVNKALEEWKLSPASVEFLLKNPFKAKHGMLSLKAIQTLLPHLEAGMSLSQAKVECYPQQDIDFEPYPLLPFPPGTCFHSKHSKKSRSQQQEERVKSGAESARAKRLLLDDDFQPITNPVVRKALFEVRKVVNAIIRKYGKPEFIRVELARETKGSIDQRNDRAKENAKRKREKDDLKKQIKAALSTYCGAYREPTGGDILKYRLWKECGGISAYSGKSISEADLYSNAVHVDHIIPFSRSLDDSFSNKVLCFHDENADKGNETPYEWMSHNTEKYHEMLERVRHFSYIDRRTRSAKIRRFEQQSVDELDGFIARKLTDTQYIATQVTKYLECLYPPVIGGKRHVQVGRGQTTADLRHFWGLDGILWELNQIPYDEQSVEKNRDDHRHHAIDAMVVALTSPSTLKHFANRKKYRAKTEGQKTETYPTPWADQPTFRNHVKETIDGIIVSHAPTRRVRGALHQETLYGGTEKQASFEIYKPILSLTKNQVEAIVDDRIRKLIRGIVDESEKGWDDAKDKDIQKILKENQERLCFPVQNGGKKPCTIRRVKLRVTENKTIPLERSGGMDAHVTSGSNHHVEIFEWEEKGKMKRDAICVTRFDAAERIRKNQELFSSRLPTKENAKLYLSLCNNDIVWVSRNGAEPQLCRVQKQSLSTTIDISFRLLNSANTKDKNAEIRVQSLDPKKFEGTKIDVGVLGEPVIIKERK